MAKPELVYVHVIKTTPERAWRALTDPEFTARYWYGTRLESDWMVGSRVVFRKPQGEPDEGTVLVADRPRCLSYTWEVTYEPLKGERPSRVTFTIEPAGAGVKLTLVHDEFDEGSRVMAAMDKGGWPGILARLRKTLEAEEGRR